MPRGALVFPLLLVGCGLESAYHNFSTSIVAEASSGNTEGSSTGEAETSSSSTGGVGGSSGSSGMTGDGDTTGGTSEPAGSSGQVDACGDGVLDEGEECDDGGLEEDDGCSAECYRDRVVFLTSETWPPDMGGIMGAVGLCRQAALKSDLYRGETFEPWLSDSQNGASSRVYPGKGRYVRTDGVVVAESFEALLAGPLLAPIEVDEYGVTIGGGVWTGTRPDGTAMTGTNHCNDWHGTEIPFDKEAWGGCSTCVDGYWTLVDHPEVSPVSCSGKQSIYCFEGK